MENNYSLKPEEFKEILGLMASCPEVRHEVIKNHNSNMWWPTDVEDWKLRFIIAGLSTRVAYNSINSYRDVIKKLSSHSYDEIKKMLDKDLADIILKLGLLEARLKYIRSSSNFIDKYGESIISKSNDDLIKLIQKEVNGASYKVAQCCALYVKGYYCGVMPVDSGIKDVLAPCLGFISEANSHGHETLRKQFESLVNQLYLNDLVIGTGHVGLDLPEKKPLTWWAHLVMIYYKRLYCNKKRHQQCRLSCNGISVKKCCSEVKKKLNKKKRTRLNE